MQTLGLILFGFGAGFLAAWSWNSWVKWLGDHIRADYERVRAWWGNRHG